MLKYENVSVNINKKPILHDISLSFPYGTITTILGPNGCGKSTLIGCLNDSFQLKQGNIYLDERSLFEYSHSERAKRIAILPQLHEVPPITVRTLVSQGRFPYRGLFHSKTMLDLHFILQSMKDTNTIQFSEQLLTRLSGGELKRAYLAMILAQNTDYIVLDEPTTFLDIHHRLEFLDLLCELRNRGKTILVVLHDINEAIQIADIIIMMKEGQIVRTLTKDEFMNSDAMDEVFRVHFNYKKDNHLTYTSITRF